ncbi:MAG: HEAT repeat domain-containing protein [Nibricoccus sp.]
MKLCPSFPLVFRCAALFCVTFFATCLLPGQTDAKKQEAPADSPVKAVVENRDALLARLTKALSYGSEIGFAKPSKTDVVVALGVIGDEHAVPALAEHLANNENKFLRLRIVRALGWIGGTQVVPPLEKALKDEYPPVRKQAADVLRQLTGRDYEYDRTGQPESFSANNTDTPSANDGARLEEIAREVATRREIRQAAMAGTDAPLKKKIVEPVDIAMEDLPARLVAKTYSDLTGKLVLVSPKIAAAAITCKIEKTTLADAKAILTRALLDAGVQVVELERGVIAFTPVDSTKPADKVVKP